MTLGLSPAATAEEKAPKRRGGEEGVELNVESGENNGSVAPEKLKGSQKTRAYNAGEAWDHPPICFPPFLEPWGTPTIVRTLQKTQMVNFFLF